MRCWRMGGAMCVSSRSVAWQTSHTIPLTSLFLVPVCHRCVHEQLPIGSSLCSPTPALTITLAAHCCRSIVQCMATTSKATFSSGHGKSSTKSASSSLTTRSLRPPSSLKQNQSRCAPHNSFTFTYEQLHRKGRSRQLQVRLYTEKIQCGYFQRCASCRDSVCSTLI